MKLFDNIFEKNKKNATMILIVYTIIHKNQSATAGIYNDDGNNTKADSKACLIHNVTGPDEWYGYRSEYLDNDGDNNVYSYSSSALKNDGLHATAKV